jgi:geranylgeranyl reductase family protein
MPVPAVLAYMYDFVVVGLGPAGSRFARRAAADGYDVIGFEQGTIGTPLACSGHVSRDLWDFTGPNARAELLQNEVYGARFHATRPTENGQSPDSLARTAGRQLEDAETFYKEEPVSNVIDRVGLDQHLASLAREAGADLREHHTVTGVDEHQDHVEVTVRGPDETNTVQARMVAGCDGPRSKVRSELGLEEPTELLHGVLGFDETPDAAEYVDVHLTPPGFFAWRIPRGDAGVEFGLGAPPKADVSERFETFCDAYGVTIDRRCSGAIPIGPAESVTSHRGFLIGDAAAQTKPFTGGGILYGMTSADHAVEVIDPEWPPTLAEYEQAWRDDLEREMQLGHAIRRAYSLPDSIQTVGLRALSGEIGVHMDRPTSLLSPGGLKTLLP